MPRMPKYPAVIDELCYISVNKLPIKPLHSVIGMFNHSVLNTGFEIVATASKGKITFIYQGKEVIIFLTSLPSSLGKGVVWYFICPETGKRCTKLRFYKGKILHHSAIPANYSKQNYSKNMRALDIVTRAEFSDPGDACFKPYFKFTYKGLPTRALKRIEEKVKRYQAGKDKYLKDFWDYMNKTTKK